MESRNQVSKIQKVTTLFKTQNKHQEILTSALTRKVPRILIEILRNMSRVTANKISTLTS